MSRKSEETIGPSVGIPATTESNACQSSQAKWRTHNHESKEPYRQVFSRSCQAGGLHNGSRPGTHVGTPESTIGTRIADRSDDGGARRGPARRSVVGQWEPRYPKIRIGSPRA